jgi:hypothetical protein
VRDFLLSLMGHCTLVCAFGIFNGVVDGHAGIGTILIPFWLQHRANGSEQVVETTAHGNANEHSLDQHIYGSVADGAYLPR